jgi:hypothetical protein
MVKSLGRSASGAVSLPCGWPIPDKSPAKKADSDGKSTDAECLNSRHAYDQVIVVTLVRPPTACPHFHTRWVMRTYQRRADTADQM